MLIVYLGIVYHVDGADASVALLVVLEGKYSLDLNSPRVGLGRGVCPIYPLPLQNIETGLDP